MVAPWGSKIWSKKAAFLLLIIIVKVLTTNGNTCLISLFSCQLVSSPKSPFNSGLVHDVVVVKSHSGLTRHSGLNWFYTVHLWWVPSLIIMLICTILMCCCSALIKIIIGTDSFAELATTMKHVKSLHRWNDEWKSHPPKSSQACNKFL